MFKFFRRHRTVVMVALALCVTGLIIFGVGGSSFMASPQDIAVKVNGHKITMMEFDRVYRAMVRQQQSDPSATQQQQFTGQALNEIIRQQVLAEEAKRYGLRVTDDELRLQLASIPAFQRDGHFDPATYEQVVRRTFGIAPAEFEQSHTKDLAVRKLNLLIASAIQITDAEVQLYRDAALASEKDPKAKKDLEGNPEKLRERIREHQVNIVFSDWLNRLNSELKVTNIGEPIRQRLGNPASPAK